ncbi:PAS domain-containing protein [Polyangium aurulentum]|uniref:PAS domain-containing protein n=1 Tax=Polyangium aurulentum TaxID=2567896 RepID=UPI0010ADCE69|nr:PAS domain-containing protein [Polyangium aurulentum]UQA60711.1 PAS domain-containing protein [Polyangium aurulentum]
MSGDSSHEPPRAGRPVEALEQENAALRARVVELEASERSLRDAQRLALAVIDHSPSIVLVKAPEGSYLLVNRGLEAFFAKPRSELLGATDFDVLPPEVAKPLWEQDLEVIRTGEGRLFEDVFEREGGQQTYLTNKFPIFDGESNVVAVAMIATDITQRKQMDNERAELQQQVIAAQDAALLELSTPLMPIAEGVIAMPIVGTVDNTRAAQIMDTLLQGINHHRAHSAILDITGVRTVDAAAANALVAAARAGKLLGARVAITGVRGEVAQTLVGLDADLGGIVTRSTLQAGIAWALAR